MKLAIVLVVQVSAGDRQISSISPQRSVLVARGRSLASAEGQPLMKTLVEERRKDSREKEFVVRRKGLRSSVLQAPVLRRA